MREVSETGDDSIFANGCKQYQERNKQAGNKKKKFLLIISPKAKQ